MVVGTENRLIKSPVCWYSNPTFLRIFRVVQLLPLITLLGLLGYVSNDGFFYSLYGLIATSISTFYLIVIMIVPVPANPNATVVCVFEAIMAAIMLAAFIELGVDNGSVTCANQKYYFSSSYYNYYWSAVLPCSAAQASIGVSALAFILFTCSSVLFGVNVVKPIRRAFGVRLEGADLTARLQRGSNLAISCAPILHTDIEALAPDTNVAVPESTSYAIAEPAIVESTAVEPVAVEPVVPKVTA
ncbi:LANO_0A00276g1_1 [Lachancea nothofagi CBS 11611]|uniref:LANO_0A00276g1_1 n=1 Tax=Lachancea nothofagi CBS 11611 TaxID=1266666 RepID=A0A1G4IM20_9SACH|nr:LANO_0A00276g1_1 [Lachancea nothofagi CBS 11611]